MIAITRETVQSLLASHEPPCLSIYLPTHRRHPENQQDPILFKNLVAEVESSLREKYRGREIRAVMEKLHALGADAGFWNHTLDGLAVLACADTFSVIPLQRTVKPLAVVADSFHLKPLMRYVQSADRFQVLALTRDSAKVFEGDRYAMDPLDAPSEFPTTLTGAIGNQKTEVHQGGRKDEIKVETEKFFRVVDQKVAELFSKPTGLPLLLAALTEHHAPFREGAKNPALLPGGLEGNPDTLSLDELRKAAWAAIEPYYLARLGKMSEEFTSAQAHQHGSSDLSDVARAAVEGRVARLLVEADRVIPGRKDPATGAIADAPLSSPEVDDLLDDVAEAVLRTGGEVVVTPKDRMPVTTGLAATYRY